MLGAAATGPDRTGPVLISAGPVRLTSRITEVPDRVPGTDELAAWREFLRAHARLTRTLETELVREQEISLAAYDVLVQLAEAPGRRLRMTDLAEALLLSRSGVTRLVGRLERIGLVGRSRVAADGRGVVAVLTEAGLDRLREASSTHLAGIARHFAGPLDAGQLAALRALCEQLAGPALSPSRPAEPVPAAARGARPEADPGRADLNGARGAARSAGRAPSAGSRG